MVDRSKTAATLICCLRSRQLFKQLTAFMIRDTHFPARRRLPNRLQSVSKGSRVKTCLSRPDKIESNRLQGGAIIGDAEIVFRHEDILPKPKPGIPHNRA